MLQTRYGICSFIPKHFTMKKLTVKQTQTVKGGGLTLN